MGVFAQQLSNMTKTRKKRRLTAAEFAAVRQLLNISEDRIEAAYSALVLGEVLQVVANNYQWSRQAVNDACNVVLSTLNSYRLAKQAEIDTLAQELPDGWEIATISAPADVIAKLGTLVHQQSNSTLSDLQETSDNENQENQIGHIGRDG